jgi:hippurate hydrolase
MALVEAIAARADELTDWRRDLHGFPELAFEEVRTASFVAEKLRAFGCDEVHEGIAGTGVVAVIRGRAPGRSIALRADMDALPIHEESGAVWASATPRLMHGCGHDGHTTMLLAAVRNLAVTRAFAGTVVAIFQPAEEVGRGARAMLEAGLFTRFPAELVFGLHNVPAIPLGCFVVQPGPVMAAVADWRATVTGKGAHAALPQLGIDPVVAAAHVVLALQTLVSREIDPTLPALVTVGAIQGGAADNVIPDRVELRGTSRWLDDAAGELLQRRLPEIVALTAAAHGARGELVFAEPTIPATVNEPAATDLARTAAAAVVGADGVLAPTRPIGLVAEDFAFMLQAKPGCFVLIGTGRTDDDPMLHNPRYDFNDDALALGASFWVRLVETVSGPAG